MLTLRKTRLRVQNPCRLAAAVALNTDKIIKKLPGVFDREEDFQQNSVQNDLIICISNLQISRCKVQHCTRDRIE